MTQKYRHRTSLCEDNNRCAKSIGHGGCMQRKHRTHVPLGKIATTYILQQEKEINECNQEHEH